MAQPIDGSQNATDGSEAPPTGDAGRGAEAVKRALIEAAARRLGEAGPSNVTVRDIAKRAGVNHGQVHHYFGGKRGLLVEAMRSLARAHFEKTREETGGAAIPQLFNLADDPDYWRAVCQVTMEGDLDLARIEVDEDISVPRSAMREIMRRHSIEEDDLDFKAQFACIAALQLGWVALEDFLLLITDVAEEDRSALRARAKALLEQWIDRGLEEHATAKETP